MQLTLLRPLPRPVRAPSLLSVMHRGWEATSEEGRNKVGRVDFSTSVWDDLPAMLGTFLKEDDILGLKLWGAKVRYDSTLPPDTCLFWCSQGTHKATGRLLRPQTPSPASTPRTPLRIVAVARKPGAGWTPQLPAILRVQATNQAVSSPGRAPG